MINVPKYNKEDRKTVGVFEQLPKGAYVCKIMNIEEKTSKKGKPMVVVYFDIAEGEHKDYYATQYRESESEDKHWSYDAITYLTIPYDGCESFITRNWATFWADVEDSNNGYVFDGNEETVKGKIFGGVFRNEQTEANGGKIYDHTRLAWTKVAQDIRDGKIGTLPKDKLIESKTSVSDGFIAVSESEEEDLPFGNKKK